MKYQIKHETKKKVHEIIAAAEKRDEDLLKQLIDDVEQRADQIKANLQLIEMPQI